jgi:MFS family permease
MACMPQSSIDLFCSMYFFGFASGLLFFTLPDAIGRKRTMNFLMPLYILASTLSVFGTTIEIKSIGFFV